MSAYDMKLGAAEPPPETTKLRIRGAGGIVPCIAPVYVAQERLLHAEGFTDVRYVEYPNETQLWRPEVLVSDEADIGFSFPPRESYTLIGPLERPVVFVEIQGGSVNKLSGSCLGIEDGRYCIGVAIAWYVRRDGNELLDHGR